MAVHKITRIKESFHELKQLERSHTSGNRKRIQFLIHIQENQKSVAELASLLGKSPRTLYRWMDIYRKGGLSSLIGEGNAPSTRLTAAQLQALRKLLISGDMESLQDIRQWLKEQFGVEYSVRGVSKLVRVKLGAKRVWEVGKRGSENTVLDAHTASRNSESTSQYFKLMNNIPDDFDTIVWIEKFRDLLGTLFNDVDRITISVNANCWLLDPEKYDPGFMIVQSAHSINDNEQKIWIESHSQNQSPTKDLYKIIKEIGFPVDQYHIPVSYDYYLKGSAYLGSIIFWRYKKAMETSSATFRQIERLSPFLEYALSAVLARRHYSNPIDVSFYHAFHTMGKEKGISLNERDVLCYRLFGYSYKDIAVKVGVTEGTIKKQLQSVYRKTGTRSHAELFAKYFAPRIAPQNEKSLYPQDDDSPGS